MVRWYLSTQKSTRLQNPEYHHLSHESRYVARDLNTRPLENEGELTIRLQRSELRTARDS